MRANNAVVGAEVSRLPADCDGHKASITLSSSSDQDLASESEVVIASGAAAFSNLRDPAGATLIRHAPRNLIDAPTAGLETGLRYWINWFSATPPRSSAAVKSGSYSDAAMRTDSIAATNLTSTWQLPSADVVAPKALLAHGLMFSHSTGPAGNYIYLDAIFVGEQGWAAFDSADSDRRRAHGRPVADFSFPGRRPIWTRDNGRLPARVQERYESAPRNADRTATVLGRAVASRCAARHEERAMRIPRGWLLVVVAASISAVASSAWAASLTVSSQQFGANSRVKPAFYPRSVATANCTDLVICTAGGTAGRPENGDTVTVVFNTELKQSTMCSTWTTNVDRTGVTAVSVSVSVNDGAGSSNDTLRVSGCSGGLKFGTIDLGSGSYVSATITYGSSTLSITNATTATQIVLKLNGGSAGSTVASSVVTYSCDAALTSSSDVACGRSKSVTAAVQQF